jgi:hypothetical protein
MRGSINEKMDQARSFFEGKQAGAGSDYETGMLYEYLAEMAGTIRRVVSYADEIKSELDDLKRKLGTG